MKNALDAPGAGRDRGARVEQDDGARALFRVSAEEHREIADRQVPAEGLLVLRGAGDLDHAGGLDGVAGRARLEEHTQPALGDVHWIVARAAS